MKDNKEFQKLVGETVDSVNLISNGILHISLRSGKKFHLEAFNQTRGLASIMMFQTQKERKDMNAEEARKLNEEYAATQNLDVNDIYAKIRELAKSGKSRAVFDLQKIDPSYRKRIFDNLKKTLESNGFRISRAKWTGDQRDPGSGDELIVSW